MSRIAIALVVGLAGCPKHLVAPDMRLVWTRGVEAMSLDLEQRAVFPDTAAAAASMTSACAGGWAPACTPAWTGAGIERVRSAGDALSAGCDAGDLAACVVFGWSRVEDVPGLVDPGAKEAAAGAAALQKACDGGIARACVDLADVYDLGAGVAADAGRASTLLDGACGQGDHEACARLGQRLFDGKGGAVDPARAVALLTADCTASTGLSCVVLGGAMSRGAGVPVDPGRGMALVKSACDAGVPAACTRMGQAALIGEGVPMDPRGAGVLFDRTCAAGDGIGCDALAGMVERGTGMPKDPSRAIALKLQACMHGAPKACADGDRSTAAYLVTLDEACGGGTGDSGACVELGDLYASPKRSPSERERGLTLLRQGCDHSVGFACSTLASRYEEGLVVRHDLMIGAEYHGKACDLGLMSDCKRLGELYATGNGPAQDRTKAAAAYHKPCEQGDHDGCRLEAEQWLQGYLSGEMPDGGKKAIAALRASCTGGDAGSCGRLGELYRDGLGVTANGKEALAAFGSACGLAVDGADPSGEPFCYQIADFAFAKVDITPAAGPLVGTLGTTCDLGKDRACATLSMLYQGIRAGIAKDDEAAATRAAQGCDAGGMLSCAQLGILLKDGHGIAQDRARAETLLDQACQAQVFERVSRPRAAARGHHEARRRAEGCADLPLGAVSRRPGVQPRELLDDLAALGVQLFGDDDPHDDEQVAAVAALGLEPHASSGRRSRRNRDADAPLGRIEGHPTAEEGLDDRDIDRRDAVRVGRDRGPALFGGGRRRRLAGVAVVARPFFLLRRRIEPARVLVARRRACPTTNNPHANDQIAVGSAERTGVAETLLLQHLAVARAGDDPDVGDVLDPHHAGVARAGTPRCGALEAAVHGGDGAALARDLRVHVDLDLDVSAGLRRAPARRGWRVGAPRRGRTLAACAAEPEVAEVLEQVFEVQVVAGVVLRFSARARAAAGVVGGVGAAPIAAAAARAGGRARAHVGLGATGGVPVERVEERSTLRHAAPLAAPVVARARDRVDQRLVGFAGGLEPLGSHGIFAGDVGVAFAGDLAERLLDLLRRRLPRYAEDFVVVQTRSCRVGAATLPILPCAAGLWELPSRVMRSDSRFDDRRCSARTRGIDRARWAAYSPWNHTARGFPG